MVAEPSERKKTHPDFRPGDTVRVHIKVIEGDSERIQVFEGTVITKRGSGSSQSFTVRKISFGVGVERTFPLESPHVERIEVVKSGRVRRSRLYYLRALTGRAARLTEEESKPRESGETPKPSAPAAAKPASEKAAAPSDGAAKHPEPKAKSADSKPHGAEPKALGAAKP